MTSDKDGPTYEDLLRALIRDHNAACECKGCKAISEVEQDRSSRQ